MTDRYLVLGNPIEHSLSPGIHQQFAQQTNQSIEYDRRLVEVGTFHDVIPELQQQGVAGVNVTVPFKELAYATADESSPRAQKAGAANTLVFQEDGRIFADNTDGVGLVNDIRDNLGFAINGKDILIVGAGGAVRGVLAPLIEEVPASLTIANRTLEKAELLRDIHRDDFAIEVCHFDQLAGRQFDLVINGTSLGLQGEVAPLPEGIFRDHALAYDMMYGDGSMPFQEWALSQGAYQTVDGLGMLVGQAAESFYIWRGVRPDPLAVIHSMRTA